MIKLGLLQFSNCLPFGKDVSIDLAKNNVTQLVGKNGSGKSSIPLILEELLYNKNSKGVAKGDILNRYAGATEYSMSLAFIVDEVEYTISKEVKATAKVKLVQNGKDISGHTATQTYKLLADILGMDMATFSKLVYQSLVSSLDFLTATDGNRKKFLITLLNLEKYSNIEAEIKEAKKKLVVDIAKINTELAAANKVLAGIEIPDKLEPIPVPESLEHRYSEIMELTSEKAAVEFELKTIEARYKEQLLSIEAEKQKESSKILAWEELHRKLSRYDGLISAKEESIAALAELSDHLKKIPRPTPSELMEAKDYESKLRDELHKLQWEMDTLKDRYKVLKSDAENTVCNACNSVLDKAHAAKEAERIKVEYTGMSATRLDLRERLTQQEEVSAKLQEVEQKYNTVNLELVKKTALYQNQVEDISVLEEELNLVLASCDPDLLSTKPTLNLLSTKPTLNLLSTKPTLNLLSTKPTINLGEDTLSLQLKVKSIDSEIDKIKDEINQRSKDRERATEHNTLAASNNAKIAVLVDSHNKAKELVIDKTEALSILEGRNSKVDVLSKIFGPKGLIAYKLESCVKVFEDKVNNYLSELSNGKFALGFELDEANLKVVVYSEGKDVNIKTLSSGELSKVNISTLLAIRGLMSAIAKNSLNVLFLDEVVSTIDQDGMEDLITVLLKEYDLNTFVVSHNYTHPLVEVLKINKEHNISRIEHG